MLTTQKGISAGRDNALGDITNINSNNTKIEIEAAGAKSPIVAWMARLQTEISTDQQVLAFIDTLQMYQIRHSHDGVEGLEGKLNHAGRSEEVFTALQKKELFIRLLARYSMFDSAQQIFAYLLAKLEGDFRAYVLPSLGKISNGEVDKLIAEYLVQPCADEIKDGVFCLNSAIASGMVYWLAEQCYVRWHA